MRFSRMIVTAAIGTSLAALPACQCGAPPVEAPLDASTIDPLPAISDAGTECSLDEHCPPGFACLVSEARCIPHPDAGTSAHDAGSFDAGPEPACEVGSQRSCGASKLGECRLGVQVCEGGVWSVCQGSVDPLPESCDDRDNDCDGAPDEDFDKTSDPNHCGACGNVCAFPAAEASCVAGECQMGACHPSHRDANGDPGDGCECALTNGGVETCDGLDNDCDGQVDEDQGTLSCGIGACATSTPACQNGVLQACTPGASAPEVCDGIDNDCDGQVDEELADLTCGQGECFRTSVACVMGAPQTCVPGTPSAESCDGSDDDCDGVVDEGCACIDGTTQPCYSGSPGTRGVGVCTGGTQTCAGGQWGACNGQVVDSPETCDGSDNDCDGQVDEGLGTTSCGVGQCQVSVQNCAGGVSQTCTPGSPQAEICDGVDNDCDGAIDDGLAPLTCGTGACQVTVAACVNGAPQTCTPAAPTAEVCDGSDNDCDGATDEALGSTTCGVGACVRTVQNCVGGATQTCSPGTPTAEVCDGVDNDCDGQTDENLPTLTCGQGECWRTVPSCVGGVPQTCTPGAASTELCDGLDNDCDGQTDQTFPEAGQSCATGLEGPCGTGTYTCPSGALTCGQTVFPSSEICNNSIDEDCDGEADDPMLCGCDASIDNDADGTNQCQDCNDDDGSIHPGATESCNGKDDDCDGALDEGFDADGDGYTSCGTVPTGGISPTRIDCNDGNAFVHPGKVTDCGNAATPSTGNGVDDNCNGYVDETCGNCTDGDQDGVSTCQGDCNDNDAAVYPGATEVCDGKDTDCNQLTVDNCGVSDPCGSKKGPSWSEFPAGTDRCRPDLVCVSDLSTGALTCGSFCNATVGLGLNDSCAPGEGCNQTLLRSDNQHLCSATPVGSRTVGQSCTSHADCRSGWCRTDGWTSYCSDGCTHEASCSSNTTCYMQKSAFSQQGLLYQWFAGHCRLDSALTGTKTLGQTCTGSQCQAGPDACFNGRCTIPCCEHADCGAGYACSINGPRQSLVGTSAESSVFSACLQSSATKISGQACQSSSECRSGICEKTLGICVDLCCNDLSCPNNTTCEPVDFTFASGHTTLVRACLFSPVPAQIEQK